MTTIKWRTAYCETWGHQRHRGKGLPVMEGRMKEKRWKKRRKRSLVERLERSGRRKEGNKRRKREGNGMTKR
jgi:hypothetical protein